MIARVALVVGLGVVAWVRWRGFVVRVVRALDRRGGLASRQGQRAYTRVSRLFDGLRRRVVADAVAALGDRSAVVLDIGAGPGDLVRDLRGALPRARVTGVEPSPEMRSIAVERGIDLVDGRAEALPIADASVDLVVSTLASHHWDDPVAAFAEIRRVLSPGGEAWIDDVRFAGFGLGEARALATAAGFPAEAVARRILDDRILGLRLFARVVLSPAGVGAS